MTDVSGQMTRRHPSPNSNHAAQILPIHPVKDRIAIEPKLAGKPSRAFSRFPRSPTERRIAAFLSGGASGALAPR
jgi:hypothetical protein